MPSAQAGLTTIVDTTRFGYSYRHNAGGGRGLIGSKAFAQGRLGEVEGESRCNSQKNRKTRGLLVRLPLTTTAGIR